jgi:hypothetical protein
MRRDVLARNVIAAIAVDGHVVRLDEKTCRFDLRSLRAYVDSNCLIRLAVRLAVGECNVPGTRQAARRACRVRIDVRYAGELHLVLLAGDLEEVGHLRVRELRGDIESHVVVPRVGNNAST